MVAAVTGPGIGKVLLEGATVTLKTPSGDRVLEGAEVYIHIRGYLRARVTHLDIEHGGTNDIMPPNSGGYFIARGIEGGLCIDFSRLIGGVSLEVKGAKELNSVLRPGEKTWCYVGGKYGGLFVGFRRNIIKRLEVLAKRASGLTPRSGRA